MSFEVKALSGQDLDANIVPGGIYGLSDPLVMRVRIGNEESVISLEQFCELAERYLQGGVFGWRSKENTNAPPMPDYVKEAIKRLVQHL